MCNRSRQDTQTHDSRYIGELGSGLCKCLLRKDTLSYILYRTNVFQLALRVSRCTSHYMQEFSTTIGHHDPVGVLIIAPGLHSPCGRLVYQGYVVGMYPNLSNIGRYWGAGFNFVNAIQLLRPNSFHLIWAPGESTGSAELLAF